MARPGTQSCLSRLGLDDCATVSRCLLSKQSVSCRADRHYPNPEFALQGRLGVHPEAGSLKEAPKATNSDVTGAAVYRVSAAPNLGTGLPVASIDDILLCLLLFTRQSRTLDTGHRTKAILRNVETTSASTTTITASALAPLLYRASPIDPVLRTSSAQPDLENYHNTTPSIHIENRRTSPYPAPATFARDISRPSSTSTQSSNIALLRHHEYNPEQKPLNGAHHSHTSLSQHNHNLSLPGLSALASLASASSAQVRYVC